MAKGKSRDRRSAEGATKKILDQLAVLEKISKKGNLTTTDKFYVAALLGTVKLVASLLAKDLKG